MHVRILDNLVLLIKRNVSYWKFQKRVIRNMLFHYTGRLVKPRMNLTPLLTIWKNL